MISSMKLKQMWLKAAVSRKKRITMTRTTSLERSGASASTAPTEKGCFVVYSKDNRRFMLPLAWLTSDVFSEMLNMAEDEFGLPSDGPITLPFDAIFMEHVVNMMRQQGLKDIEEQKILASIANCACRSTHRSFQELPKPQLLVCSS